MRILLTAVAVAALIPAAAQAQETRIEERVVVVAGPGGPMEVGDEGLTREAFTARHNEIFDRMDADHDGVISREEMTAMHGRMGSMGHGPGHGPGMAMFTGEDGEQIVLDGDGEWTSEDGSRRIIVRRQGADGAPMSMEGENIEIEGLEGSGRRVVIRRRGPGGETVDVLGSGEGGERHVMVFRHEGEGGLDADGDGRWTFEEMAAPIREHFNQLDADHDGFVDAAEREH